VTEARSNIENTFNIDYVVICITHPYTPGLTRCPDKLPGLTTYVQLDVDETDYVIAVRLYYDIEPFTSEQLSYLDEQVGKEETEARSNIGSTLNINNVVTCHILRPGGPGFCPFLPSGATHVQLDVDITNGYVSAVRIVYEEGLYESSP